LPKKDTILQTQPFCTITVSDRSNQPHTTVCYHMPRTQESVMQYDREGNPLLYDSDHYFATINNGGDFVIIQEFHFGRLFKNIAYFKIETPQAAAKLRELIALGGEAIEGPWDGEEAITLMADLDAGATGAMTGGGYPDGIRQITDPYFAGRRAEAVAAYERWLPLINYENRQCGLIACKALMKEGGVIKHETVRLPLQPLHPAVRAGLIEIASRLGPLVLRWGK
jgi:hypothetical protein